MKDKTTAGILALLLGGIGVHHFYLGNTGRGVIYLLFCWTVIPTIIALVEGIQYLTMSQDKFNRKINQTAGSLNVNTADELEKLASLRDKGVITEDEFQIRKSKLL